MPPKHRLRQSWQPKTAKQIKTQFILLRTAPSLTDARRPFPTVKTPDAFSTGFCMVKVVIIVST